MSRYGSLDIAFNNAGAIATGKVAEIDEHGWSTTLAVNLTGVWQCLKITERG